MSPGPAKIPLWIKVAAALAVLAAAGAAGLLALGALEGPRRNLAPQAAVGAAMALVALAACVYRFHAAGLGAFPSRLVLGALTLAAAGAIVLYAHHTLPLLELPYDVACWSEPMFVTAIVKWSTGAAQYTPPEDSNSIMYTFGAPWLTWVLASLAGRGDSIVAFRWIQQGFLLLAALAAALAARDVLRLSMGEEKLRRVPRLWLSFFLCVAFLSTVNVQTGAFNVYLHNDPLGVLAGIAGFFAMTRHAVTRNSRWLWAMAVMPAAGFMVKQYLAILAGVYLVYLWIAGRESVKRQALFSAASFGLLAGVVGICLARWGGDFRYWVFTIMGSHIISVEKIVLRFSDAAVFLLPGVAAGLLLLRGDGAQKLLGIWAGWWVMVLGGLYTSGITFSPTHLGPASLAGLCFGLAALAQYWPDPRAEYATLPRQWLEGGVAALAVLFSFGAFQFFAPIEYRVTPDMRRYATAIEREFAGAPAGRVLLDFGEWIYLRQGVAARDRMPILVTHRGKEYSGLAGRMARGEYDRILVRHLSSGRISYGIGSPERERVFRELLEKHYRLARTIPGVAGMENWRYFSTGMGEVQVYERQEATGAGQEKKR